MTWRMPDGRTPRNHICMNLLTSLSAQALSGTRTNLQLLNQQKPFLPWDWAEPITLGSWQFYGLHKLTSKGMHQYTHSDSKAYLTGLIRNKWLMNHISDFQFGCEDRRTFSHVSTMYINQVINFLLIWILQMWLCMEQQCHQVVKMEPICVCSQAYVMFNVFSMSHEMCYCLYVYVNSLSSIHKVIHITKRLFVAV